MEGKKTRIRQVIKDKGVSQAWVARKAGVNESSMSRIVRGVEPPFPHRGQRIADALEWEGEWSELFEEIGGN